MKYVLSDEGRQALRILTTRSILYAFDFDGTLAGILSDRGTRTAKKRLMISGRFFWKPLRRLPFRHETMKEPWE